MLAISIRQPWAFSVFNFGKDVENRNWFTKVRGRVLVHAAKTVDSYGYDFLESRGLAAPGKKEIEKGGIVGSVEISGCVKKSGSDWFFGKYGFILINPIPLPFVEWKGKLGFFDIPYDFKNKKIFERFAL